MVKQLNKPITLLVINGFIGVVGFLSVALGTVTFGNVYSEQDHIIKSIDTHIIIDEKRHEIMVKDIDNNKDDVNELKVLIHEMLVEQKHQNRMMNDIKETQALILKELRSK